MKATNAIRTNRALEIEVKARLYREVANRLRELIKKIIAIASYSWLKFSRTIIIILKKLARSLIDRLLIINIEFNLAIETKIIIIILISRLFSSIRINKSCRDIID